MTHAFRAITHLYFRVQVLSGTSFGRDGPKEWPMARHESLHHGAPPHLRCQADESGWWVTSFQGFLNLVFGRALKIGTAPPVERF